MDRIVYHAEYLQEIHHDRQRGAAMLARRCLEIMAETAGKSHAPTREALSEELTTLASNLRMVRPTMVPILNVMDRWLEEFGRLEPEGLEDLRAAAMHLAILLAEASVRASQQVARHARQLVGPGATIFTHSFSSTIQDVFFSLREEGVRAIVTESRPLREGRQLARRLCELRIPVTYITEAQMGLFVSSANCVLVGADAVLADGSVVNKAGTYPLALVARDQGVPFYVCCESLKFDLSGRRGEGLEEMSVEELDPPHFPGLTPRNIYFDVTPARLVSGWITEYGLMREFSPQRLQLAG